MDFRWYHDDLIYDGSGDYKCIEGREELLALALRRLRMKRGSFPYLPQVGSTLPSLDLNRLTKEGIGAVIEEALEGLDGVQLLSVDELVQKEDQTLALWVTLSVQQSRKQVELHGI